MSPGPLGSSADDADDAEVVDVVDLDLHCVPDREHCVRLDDPHLDAIHLDDRGF